MAAVASVARLTETAAQTRSEGHLTIEALVAALDPEVRAAIDDVDRSLIMLSLEMSPGDRLRSASRMAQTLARLRDAATSQRR
jgi:hypothetical protein